jgi:hypothetical protein
MQERVVAVADLGFGSFDTPTLIALIDDAMASLVLRVEDPHESEVDYDVRELARPAFDSWDAFRSAYESSLTS